MIFVIAALAYFSQPLRPVIRHSYPKKSEQNKQTYFVLPLPFITFVRIYKANAARTHHCSCVFCVKYSKKALWTYS